jgi:hypothetical protein
MVNIITSNKLPWYAQTGLAQAGDGQVLYTHVLVDEFQKVGSNVYKDIGAPLLEKVKEIDLDFFRVLRIKINCYPNQTIAVKSSYHVDLPKAKSKILVLNINTNNGYTEFKNPDMKSVRSVANQCIIFDGKEEHRSVSQTDTPYRWNINFNYEC